MFNQLLRFLRTTDRRQTSVKPIKEITNSITEHSSKVLLIAGNKEEWKTYFEKNIRYRIEWIEKKKIQQGVIFSIIAIKSVTEKIEEVVRELISKYEVEIRGAKQMFIFLTQTNNLHFETNFVKTKDRYLYATIKVAYNGIPAETKENQKLIDDLKAELINEDDSSDEKNFEGLKHYDEAGIPLEVISKFQKRYSSNKKNPVAENLYEKQDVWDVCRKQTVVTQNRHVFNTKISIKPIPTEGKPMTNQKSSGRCWIFACLNVIRSQVTKKFKVKDLEFSQNYLFFWDKIERINYMLEAYIDCARKGETPDGRLVLNNPTEDGGQWDMLINLIEKYGIVPIQCCPDAQSSESAMRMGKILNNKTREFCMKLQKLVFDGSSEEVIQKTKRTMLEEIYNILLICLGSPPETFTWEYHDSDKKYNKIGPIKPLDFYKEYIKPIYNMEDKICIVNDPREKSVYDKLYTVDYLGNMPGGKLVLYINQPVEMLKKLTMKSIKAGEAVWFGCDVGKQFNRKGGGILDLDIIDLDPVFGTSLLNMSKAERLMHGESLMTHAMVLTDVIIENEKSTKWRVENFWGDCDGDKGYLVMTDDWFSEFVYEVVIDKKYIPDTIIEVLKQKPTVLPAWDPMGSLAN